MLTARPLVRPLVIGYLPGLLLPRDRLYWARRWGLVSRWSGDGLLDSYGANTLTNNNVATFTAGKVGNAFTLVRASSQSLSVASGVGLQTGDIDFWAAAWGKLASKPASSMDMLSRYSLGTTSNRTFIFAWQQSTDRFAFVIEDGSGTANTVLANTLGSPSLATWYFVMAYHDAVNNLLGISVNGGAWDTQATTVSPGSSTVDCVIGNRSGGTTLWDGQVDEVIFGKSTPGGIAARATEIRDRLYNGGSGRPFPFS